MSYTQTKAPGRRFPERRPDRRLPEVSEIKQAYIDRGQLLDFCKEFLPGGRRIRDEWVCGAVDGTEGSSFTFGLSGPFAGVGWERAGNMKYDIIDVIEANRSMNRSDAITVARNRLAMPVEEFSEYVAPEPSPEDLAREEERRQRDVAAALLTWNECVDVVGTDAEAYLRGRGITRSMPMSFRFHPKLGYWEWQEPTKPGEKGRNVRTGFYPALVCMIQRADGSFAGIHRIYLAEQDDAETGEISIVKAPVATPKKARGDLKSGGYILCCDPDEIAGKLGICEGVEDACSVPDVYDMPAVAAVSAGGVEKIILPEWIEEPVFFPDNDAAMRNGKTGKLILNRDGNPRYAGLDAATKAATRLKPKHPGARIHKVRGPTGGEKDVNAVLLAERALAQKATA